MKRKDFFEMGQVAFRRGQSEVLQKGSALQKKEFLRGYTTEYFKNQQKETKGEQE